MQSLVGCGVVGIFIVLDIASGIIKGLHVHGLNSSVMRKGLYRKLAEVLALCVTIAIDYAGKFIDIGIFPTGLCYLFCGYIGIMEIVSIVENICEVNPQIKSFFKPYLEKFRSSDEKESEKNEH